MIELELVIVEQAYVIVIARCDVDFSVIVTVSLGCVSACFYLEVVEDALTFDIVFGGIMNDCGHHKHGLRELFVDERRNAEIFLLGVRHVKQVCCNLSFKLA